MKLFADKAPLAVNNFVFLAKNGWYDGVTFHRVLTDFMAQGGDPTGLGLGGPGYSFANEVTGLKFDKEGLVAMANAGPDTNGSQFFITYGPAAQSRRRRSDQGSQLHDLRRSDQRHGCCSAN